MSTRARLALLVGASLTPMACGPFEAPWLLGYPATWGISTHVIEDGPYASVVGAPPGRTRSEMLPGDTLELRWTGAGPPGARLRPPIWLVGSGLSTVALEDCPSPLTGFNTLCRLGAGDRVQFKLDRDFYHSGASYYAQNTVLAIASDGDRIEPETCVKRAFSERDADLGGCLIAVHSVVIGPRGALWRHFPHTKSEGPPVADIPAEYLDAPGNLNPVFEAFHLEHGEAVAYARDGDTVTVRPGEHVRVTARLNADVVEEWRGLTSRYTLVAGSETITVASRLNYPVYDHAASEDGLTVEWTAPDAAEEVTLYMQAADGRGGFDSASLRLVSVSAGVDEL